MWIPGRYKPMTPAGWQVLGCLVLASGLSVAGLGLYACIRNGFDDPLALKAFVGGAVVAVGTAAAWWGIHRWMV